MPPRRSAFYRRATGRGCRIIASDLPGKARMLQPPDPARITSQLVELRLEHRDLDAAIARLADTHDADDLAVKRLKKRKLRIKDMIATLESRLIPDLDA